MRVCERMKRTVVPSEYYFLIFSPVHLYPAFATRQAMALPSSARACRAALRPTMPPRAARLDPRDAYCSRNPPPHLTTPTTRCALSRGASGCTPLGLAPPAYSRSQVQPLPWRRPRDASAAAHSPPLSRARPPSLSSGKRATRSRLLANRRPAPVRAPRTRESVPAASSRRSRRDVLPVGAALLSPARSLFPFSMPLSSTLCTASYTPHVHVPIYPQSSPQCFLTLVHMVIP